VLGPLLLLVGCALTAAAAWMLRRNGADWRRFRGAVRVTGEVIDVAPESGRTARVRVQFPFRGQSHEVVLSAWWNAEDDAWFLGGSRVGERIQLLVPSDRPDEADAAGDVTSLVALPGGVGLIGLGALGFGLLLLTESLVVAGPIFVVAWIGGLGIVIYHWYLNRGSVEHDAAPDRHGK
jgi:hypothetical protein